MLDQQLELVFADKNALRILGGGQPCFPSCGKLELGMDILSQIRSEAALTDLETVHAKKLALTASCSSKPLWARLHVARTEIGLPFLVVTFDRGEPVQSWLGQVRACGVSRRETEVIAAVLQGLTNQEVARSLFISEHTVENHLKSIYRKLGVKNRTRLMRALTQ